MNEVAYQDEVVAVLKKSIQGADVTAKSKREVGGCMCTDISLALGAQPSLLWTTRYWQDFCHFGCMQGTLWCGDDEGSSVGVECLR